MLRRNTCPHWARSLSGDACYGTQRLKYRVYNYVTYGNYLTHRRNTCFLGLTRVHIPNGISIGSTVYAQLTAKGHILYNGPPLPPIALGDLDPPSNTWFPGPTQVHSLNGISIGSAVPAGLTIVTTGSPLVIGVEDTEDSKPKDGRR